MYTVENQSLAIQVIPEMFILRIFSADIWPILQLNCSVLKEQMIGQEL